MRSANCGLHSLFCRLTYYFTTFYFLLFTLHFLLLTSYSPFPLLIHHRYDPHRSSAPSIDLLRLKKKPSPIRGGLGGVSTSWSILSPSPPQSLQVLRSLL